MSESGFQRVVTDIGELCELQWELFLVDSREARKSLAPAMLATIAVICLVVAAIVAFTLGLAWTLAQQTALDMGSALLLVALFAALIALGSIWFAWSQMNHALDHYRDSRSEFSENLRWLKSTLLQPEVPREEGANPLATSEPNVGRPPSPGRTMSR